MTYLNFCGCPTIAFPFNCYMKNYFLTSTYMSVIHYLDSLYIVSIDIRSLERALTCGIRLKIFFKNIELKTPSAYFFNKTM